MPLPTDLPPASILETLGWQALLDAAPTPECVSYAGLLNKAAQAATDHGDSPMVAVLAVLSAAASLHLRPDSREEPYGPMAAIDGWRTPAPEDFTDGHLDLIREAATRCPDPELRARLADLVWVRRRDREMATLAVDAYITSAERLRDFGEWPPFTKRVQRAINVAASLGRDNEHLRRCIEFVEANLDRGGPSDPAFTSARLMEMLLDRRVGDPSTQAGRALGLAERAETDGDFDRARTYLDLARRWFERDNRTEEARAARMRIVDLYERDAEVATSRPGRGAFAAAYLMRQALEECRRVPGTEERRQALNAQLLQYQATAADEMVPMSFSIDVREPAERIIAAVEGQPLELAFARLAVMPNTPTVASAKRSAERDARMSVVLQEMPIEILDSRGRRRGMRGSLTTATGAAELAALRAEMHRQSSMHRDFMVQALIAPGLDQIRREHALTTDQFRHLVTGSPFVPPGREGLFARGLAAGANGDLTVAAHLLVPQLENAIRRQLEAAGVQVVGLDRHGIQHEQGLGDLLTKPESEQILGADVTFDLLGLLISPFGDQLRDLLAHGLIDEADFDATPWLYCWWVALRLCILPLIRVERPEGPDEAQEAERHPTSDTIEAP